VRKLFRSVGAGFSRLNNLLKKLGMDLKPEDSLCSSSSSSTAGVGLLRAGRGNEKRIILRTKQTFESEVLKDWNMPVCGIHQGWIEGVLKAVTGKPWFALRDLHARRRVL